MEQKHGMQNIMVHCNSAYLLVPLSRARERPSRLRTTRDSTSGGNPARPARVASHAGPEHAASMTAHAAAPSPATALGVFPGVFPTREGDIASKTSVRRGALGCSGSGSDSGGVGLLRLARRPGIAIASLPGGQAVGTHVRAAAGVMCNGTGTHCGGGARHAPMSGSVVSRLLTPTRAHTHTHNVMILYAPCHGKALRPIL